MFGDVLDGFNLLIQRSAVPDLFLGRKQWLADGASSCGSGIGVLQAAGITKVT